ncbi:MAG: sigma-70 family RNA polymerase sigma factor [Massilibacteroides sp.]|nr:sigma-70 family RNA polymerase sigma factor [Massilibacteroides sp.]
MNELLKMTDEDLVMSYSNGNNSAFDVLLKRYQNSVYNNIFFTVHDCDLANDIFQDTFVKAIITIKQGRYTENGKFKGWINRIAHNLVIDYFRQNKNQNTISNDLPHLDLLNNKDFCEGTVEDDYVREQVCEDVRNLVSHLPDNQREVLEMRYYKDLSFKEIADLTGVSINTALGRMRYAILNLRRLAEKNKIELTFV